MSTRVILDLPDSALSATHTPEEFGRELRVAAAAKWYEVGQLSQGKAAELAGLSRHDFLVALQTLGVSPFQETGGELASALAR